MTNSTHLRRKRLERGLSLDIVADAIGISKSSLARAEAGKRGIKRENARALYAYYDYEIDLADIYDPHYDAEVVGATE
jgi:transcriptional regulator with XRE-family HTH domain